MQKRLHLLIALLAFMVTTAMAQITTSSVSGKITANGEDVIGATIKAVHQPSGTVYRAVTNIDGRYSIQGMRPGGPYVLEVSYVGYKTKSEKNITLSLGQNTILNESLSEDAEMLQDVVVTASRNNNMRTDRAGATTSINADQIESVPTVSRSMNDLLKLTPQGANVGSGFSVGGGNYRQSYVTVDGAAFNNAFGIGGNLPGNGSPISLDALDQISVSSSPYDVRLSGFTGGAISAVTKSGTNQFKGTAYMYTTNSHLKGNKVDDYELNRLQSHSTTWGASIGGPIIKDKLFFFVNGEYQNNISAGPSGTARLSENDTWSPSNGTVHRPLQSDMDNMLNYLNTTYGYNPGRYQGYSLDTPSYKVLARLDWNINENNKVNFRFSKSHDKDSNAPSNSTTPFKDYLIYPGNQGLGISSGKAQAGRTANSGLYFESARYYQEKNFTSFAAEWNSKWGSVSNVLRGTYSYQDEPRTYLGGVFPTVDILKDGAYYMGVGPDPFTEGNLRQVKTFVVTDEASWSLGIQNFTAGVQYESNEATNGFGAASAGYYVYSSPEDFMAGGAPAAYGVTFPMDGSSQFKAKMKYNQFSAYIQDQVNFSERFRLTGGLRFELPIYPELKNNYNNAFAALKFTQNDGSQVSYATDQLPDAPLTVSPRVGFNWDILGNHKLVLRGGTGYFVGRLPFVWLVSAVGNAGCGQYTYFYNKTSEVKNGILMDKFYTSRDEQVKRLNELGLSTSRETAPAPSAPTIIDKDLKMNATWKSSLAIDMKLPYDIDFSLEGIYSREFNPAIVLNKAYYYDGTSIINLAPGDTRRHYTYGVIGDKDNEGKQYAYMITNAGHKAYYYSITASLAKRFDFGLNLSASYTFSHARSYSDGVGDQVNSAYYNNRYSVNGNNDMELGYGTYVAPNRLLISASYKKDYAKHFGSEVGLIYEGMNIGYADGYSCTRYSYTLGSNVVNDYGSNALMYVPESREALDSWNFMDVTNSKGEVTYSAKDQRDDLWNYINQDSYLKNRKGKYAERGGAVMPWHHQLDFKFNQNFYLNVGGQKNTLQFGVDIKNLANLLNSSWGLYKTVNKTSALKWTAESENKKTGVVTPAHFNFQKNGKEILNKTYSNLTSFNSTYSIQFSIRYIFN